MESIDIYKIIALFKSNNYGQVDNRSHLKYISSVHHYRVIQCN